MPAKMGMKQKKNVKQRGTKKQSVSTATQATGLYSKSEKNPKTEAIRNAENTSHAPSSTFKGVSGLSSAKNPKLAGYSSGKQTKPSPSLASRSRHGKPASSHGSSANSSSTTSTENTNSTSATSTKPKLNQKMGKKYKSVLVRAKKAVNKDMSTKERKDVVAARKQLKKMRKRLTNKGYGSLDTEKNKKGGYNAHGIYKALTGKKYEGKK